MSATTPQILDHTSAIEVLKEYKRDGLDVQTLLDSDKRGGLTYVLPVLEEEEKELHGGCYAMAG